MNAANWPSPLVSVIIPCYNQGHFLTDAINSCLEQTYPAIEIIVINDGSIDATADVLASFSNIRYRYQDNRGLSAARNTGISMAKGTYYIFLDADDCLLPHAIAIQVAQFTAHPEAVLVAGAHEKADERLMNRYLVDECPKPPCHWEDLLRGNFIGMHAAVMYRADCLDSNAFDTQLPAVEDYDLYLRLTESQPYHCHSRPIAIYRIHGAGMSRNHPWMLRQVLTVLDRQQSKLKTAAQRAAWKEGRSNFREYYSLQMLQDLEKGLVKPERKIDYLTNILRYRPTGWYKAVGFFFN